MDKEKLYWMNYSIEVANGKNSSKLHVGAVLISKQNKLICSAFTDEKSNSSWCTTLLYKIRKYKVNKAQSLFLTINTVSSDFKFDLNDLLTEISINEIYLGVPDPNLTNYIPNDPIITFEHIYRYPDNLQRKILEQNYKYYASSKQNIKLSPYYSTKRISNLVLEKLKEKGIVISKSDLYSHKEIDELIGYLVNKYDLSLEDTNNLVNAIVAEAFDEKYALYNYSDDARSINIDWKENFISVYNKLLTSSIEDKEIINVGVGSGNEAIALFSKCKNITFVDIAKNGLENIRKKIPHSKVIISRAENLSSLANDSFDLYISLRTYNSSFFDIKQAIAEASRVLKSDGIIMISIANGFLCPDQKYIIPGLILPGTEYVDIYRGIDMIKSLVIEFSRRGFRNIQIFPTNIEIYLSAIVM